MTPGMITKTTMTEAVKILCELASVTKSLSSICWTTGSSVYRGITYRVLVYFEDDFSRLEYWIGNRPHQRCWHNMESGNRTLRKDYQGQAQLSKQN